MENKKTYIIMYGAFLTLIIMVLGISGFYASQTKVNAVHNEEPVVYTCPMHPEVVSDVPGDCPKCGMALVINDDTRQSKKPCSGCSGEKMSMEDGCGKMSGHDHNTHTDHNTNKTEETGTESKHKGCMGH